MVRLIYWVLAVGLTVGFGPSLMSLTIRIAKAAAHAHDRDQMSYSKFTGALLNAKPRVIQNDSNISH